MPVKNAIRIAMVELAVDLPTAKHELMGNSSNLHQMKIRVLIRVTTATGQIAILTNENHAQTYVTGERMIQIV